jgi:endonuclease/exonuclease/phosphatase family metal-dependent hydrolase
MLVFGDFNADESNPAFRSLLTNSRVPLRDTFRDRHPNATNVGTFNAFRGDSTQGKIDAILASPHWTVLDATIDRRQWGSLWASDHFAVAAIVRRPR